MSKAINIILQLVFLFHLSVVYLTSTLFAVLGENTIRLLCSQSFYHPTLDMWIFFVITAKYCASHACLSPFLCLHFIFVLMHPYALIFPFQAIPPTFTISSRAATITRFFSKQPSPLTSSVIADVHSQPSGIKTADHSVPFRSTDVTDGRPKLSKVSQYHLPPGEYHPPAHALAKKNLRLSTICSCLKCADDLTLHHFCFHVMPSFS